MIASARLRAVALCAGMLLLWVGSAFADGDPATDGVPRLVPYQGRLEKDGVAITGSVKMVFRLYDGDAGPEVWMEAQNVPMHAGRFVVLLGQCRVTPGDAAVCPDGDQAAKAIDEVVRNADDLQLAVDLITAEGTVSLTQRKRLLPTPYGLWSTDASNFHVWSNLTVDGDSTVTGAVTAGSVSAGTVSATGSVSAPVATIGSTTIKGLQVSYHRATASGAGSIVTVNSSIPVAHGACFLNEVTHWQSQSVWNHQKCLITRSGTYRVQAEAGPDANGASYCEMTCIRWNW